MKTWNIGSPCLSLWNLLTFLKNLNNQTHDQKAVEAALMKWPTFTKSTSSQVVTSEGNQVAPRDNGKFPREQDWGPPGTPLKSYIHTIQIWLCVH